MGSADDRRHTEEAARQLWEILNERAERRDIPPREALREMCEVAVASYEDTEEQHIADWAREMLSLFGRRGSGPHAVSA